jgi:molecular chaperone DnaK (HSP70)
VFNFKPDLGKGDKEFSRDKKYWYYLPPTEKHDKKIQTLSAKEAAKSFLIELLKDVTVPSTIVIGEPAVRDTLWKENFRKHMREIFKDMGLAPPKFFYEPFAVFQYYRHLEKIFPPTYQPETVLVVDMGGGLLVLVLSELPKREFWHEVAALRFRWAFKQSYAAGHK